MDDRTFIIEHDGLRLHAKLDLPGDMPEKCPVLVLLHGFTGHMEEPHLRAIAGAACGEGYAVLRVDQYGHGQSDGTFENHDVMKWVSMAVTIIDCALALPFAQYVCLGGHSQGGLTAILAGAIMRDRLRALLPLSPALCIPDDARRGDLFGARYDPERVPPFVPVNGSLRLGGNYLRIAQFLPVEESIRAYRGPVLIVHGEADEVVPVRYAREAAQLYENCELVILPGDDHGYNRRLDEVTRTVGAFLRRLRR